MAVYSAASTPEWGNLLGIAGGCFEGSEFEKPTYGTLVPARRKPIGELVRVHFNPVGDFRVRVDVTDAIRDELLPSLIGIGQIAIEDDLEGFKVFRVDHREVDRACHRQSSEVEITPDMIDAGAREFLDCRSLMTETPEDAAESIFRAMALAQSV